MDRTSKIALHRAGFDAGFGWELSQDQNTCVLFMLCGLPTARSLKEGQLRAILITGTQSFLP